MSSVMDVQLKKTGGKAKVATKKTPVVKKHNKLLLFDVIVNFIKTYSKVSLK